MITHLTIALKKAGVEVHLNQEGTPNLMRKDKPDSVVIATGSIPAPLDIPGADGKNVVQAVDVYLAGPVGERVVVIGGRTVGISTALYLAQQGKKVSVVTRSKIAKGFHHNAKQAIFEYLIKNDVRLFPDYVADSITDRGVNIWWNSGEPSVKDDVFSFIPADTIVLAVGAVSENKLESEIKQQVGEVYVIGDAAGKRSIFAAVRGGTEVGGKI